MHVKLHTEPNLRGWALSSDDGNFDRGIVLHDNRFGGVAAGVGYSYSSTLGMLTLNSWNCVAVSYDGPAATATIFKNGQVQTVSTLLGAGLPTTALGGNPSYLSHAIDGLVDEVFIYDRALSRAEMSDACAGVLT